MNTFGRLPLLLLLLLLSGNNLKAVDSVVQPANSVQADLDKYIGEFRWYGGDDDAPFKIRPCLEIAVALQAMPHTAAALQLQKWAASGKYETQVVILCRMLFESKAGVVPIERWLMKPICLGDTKESDWPDAPLAYVDGIPFSIAHTFFHMGAPSLNSSDCVNYCLTSEQWTSRQFRVASVEDMQKALAKLIKSPTWKSPLDKEDIEFLTAQISIPD